MSDDKILFVISISDCYNSLNDDVKIYENITLSNDGYDEEDFIEAAKEALKSIYQKDGNKVECYTKEEYKKMIENEIIKNERQSEGE